MMINSGNKDLEIAVSELIEDISYAIDNEMRIKILRTLIKANKPLTSRHIIQNSGIQIIDEVDMLDHLSELVRLGYIGMTETIPKVYYITSFMKEILRVYEEFKEKKTLL